MMFGGGYQPMRNILEAIADRMIAAEEIGNVTVFQADASKSVISCAF